MKTMPSNSSTIGERIMRPFTKLSVVAALAVLSACAGDVKDIDRTQPNKVQKSTFEGEWFYRATVLETDYNNSIVFEGYEGSADRIRWDITEDQLIGYRSYESLVGAEEGSGSPDFQGGPVVAFKIVSHFDVLRTYNEATGEQSNILVENSSDRPWYEREYMRVDWSMNLVNSPYSLESYVQAYSMAPFYVQEDDIESPYRPEITATNINVVGSYFLEPDLWTCYYAFFDVTACGGASALMKLSFRKVDPANDYETLYYPDNIVLRDDEGQPLDSCRLLGGLNSGECYKEYVPVFERFGFFRHERRVYDNEYQWLRDGRVFVGHRWNIWRKSKDGNGNLIPAEYRSTKEIQYFVNEDFPADLMQMSHTLVGDWNEAFKATVNSVRAQNEDTAGADSPDIFVLYENACNPTNVGKFAKDNGYTSELSSRGIDADNVLIGNLKRACAILEWVSKDADKKFTWQKPGDLRHSYIVWVDTPQAAGPLGYGPSSADPITGEIISANANIYGASLDSYAAYAADLVGAMNDMPGYSMDEVMNGTNVREAMAASTQRWGRPLSPETLADQATRQRANRGDYMAPGLAIRYDGRHKRFAMQKSQDTAQVRSPVARALTKANRIKGTALEKELLTSDEIRRGALGPIATQTPTNLSPQAQEQVAKLRDEFSPLSWLDEDVRYKHTEAINKLAARGIEIEFFTDDGMVSLAGELQGMTWEQVYEFMRAEMYRSVTAHEVGHTLGLRHNFQGSIDPLNYFPQFWNEHYEWDSTTRQSSIDMVGGGEQYMYSSIMDYDARFYADSFKGIGLYDKAAIKFGYGQLVEVFPEGNAALGYDSLMWLHDYVDYPKIFGLGTCKGACMNFPDVLAAIGSNGFYDKYSIAINNAYDAEDRGDMTAAAGFWNEADINYEQYTRYMNTYWMAGLDASTPDAAKINERLDVPFATVLEGQRQYYMWSYGLAADYDPSKLFDEVPYKFCTDELADYTWVECKRYDKGANYLEVTKDRMVRYDAYYPFRNFKRDRFEFNDWNYLNGYINGLYGRFFAEMANVFIYSLYSNMDMGKAKDGHNLTLMDFPVGRDWQAAGDEGLNFLISIIEAPEPGVYCLDAATNTYQPKSGACASGDEITVPVGVGKYYDTKWSDEYYYKATRIGHFWDKYLATYAMTDNEGFFYRDFSSYFDSGAFALSYWSSNTYKEELLEQFGATFQNKPSKFAWRYNAAGSDAADKFIATRMIGEDAATFALPSIQPSSSWTLRWYNIILPMIRYNALFDYADDFSNYTRVCLRGYVDCMDFTEPAGWDAGANGPYTVSFVDPLSHYEYVAPATDLPQYAVGAKMLREAQSFADDVYTPAKDGFDTAIAADPDMLVQATRDADLALRVATAQLNEIVSYIDIVRMMGYYMD